MPVAIRKRSWEDHVTPRTGLQYSYDDLDLVCCHVRYQRSRCASLPECGHHQPRTLGLWTGDATRTMESIVQKFKGGAQPNCEGYYLSNKCTLGELTFLRFIFGIFWLYYGRIDQNYISQIKSHYTKLFFSFQSSREEREKERSCLDSMVLLIMKLDQLDKEIENALSSSLNGTPNLKRRIISVMDLEMLDSAGSLSASSQSLNTPLYRSSSSLASSGTSGARPKNEVISLSLSLSLTEIEAKEACTWLRAAGFPQYAQLYEDGQFPLEISSVTRDHDFLDQDAIEALCRRLNTLNKCALMRLEITPQRKRSEDSDEDEPCAISGRWTFQRDSKRWSRLDQLDLDVFSPPAGDIGRGGSLSTTVPSSPATTISNANTATTTRASSVASVCSSGTSGANEDSLSDGLPSPLECSTFAFDVKPSLISSGAEKSTRSRAKSFLKRMESLRLRTSSNAASKRKKKGVVGQGRLEISGPVLKEGLDEDKLRRLNCVDIATLDRNANQNRSITYSTQMSSGSAGSSQSEASSGSAVSTPSPVSRARSHSTAAGSTKRGGMYLEGFDPFNFSSDNRRMEEKKSREEEGGVIFFYLPEGHKPGTFPKALADGGSFRGGDNISRRPPRRGSAASLDSRLSVYDNVPFSEVGDDEDEAEGEEESKLEDVLERVSGLQRLVSAWSETGNGEEEEDEEEEEGDSDSALDSASPCPSSPLQNCLEETENGSDQDSTGNPLAERDETLSSRERCDSGVGASLTRANRPQKLRWPSFQSSHRPSLLSTVLQVGCQSVLQMNLLQKYSLLKLTALLERYTPTNKHGFSWAVPKFMKRIKVRDYKDKSVFGVPLQVIVQRTGQPLPQSIQQAMRYLRSQCLDQVGLFRKSGVKSRIQALRQMNESCGAGGGGVNYEGQSAYDVADMLKQYFRDLPEPLLTSKLSDTFLQIYQYVPKEQRLQAVRAAVLLLPDENREALQTLLCFLSDVTASVGENQMTCTNLAVCLAPSLFHLNTMRRESSSPRVMNRKNTLGKPDQRDLNENLAATHGLAHMIQECRKLFLIPEEMSRCRNSYVEQGLSPMRMEVLVEDCGSCSYQSLLKDSIDALLKEAKDKFKGYDSCSTPENAELAYKKVQDGSSLRQWKVCVDVPASAEDILQQILREQERWDEDLLECRIVETLEHNMEVYQYVRNSMPPHPPRDHVVLRSWVTDLPKGVCALVCVSVDHESAAVLGVRANVLTSRYYIEPCGPNKSRLTHISRIDCRGRCPEWYNKLYGHLCAAEVVRIRDSFTCLDK
uniref:Rho GTPase-activating protein 7 n=1 Tax=Cyprinus carpio TaxID=7962 RepID=A0A8C1ZNL0_CYPCA